MAAVAPEPTQRRPAVETPIRQSAPVKHSKPVKSGEGTRLARLADWRIWAVCTVVWGTFAGVFFTSSAPFAIPTVKAACGQPPPDMRLYSSAADVMGFLTACGPAGRDAYRALQFADLAYPAVFALFLTTSLVVVISALAPRRRGLLAWAALPAVGAVFDYAENTCAWLALAAYPEPSAASSVLGLASAAKNAASWTAGITTVVLAAILVITRFRARHAGESR